jgi:hypothetical protein
MGEQLRGRLVEQYIELAAAQEFAQPEYVPGNGFILEFAEHANGFNCFFHAPVPD